MSNGTSVIISSSSDDILESDRGIRPVPWWSVTKTVLAACALKLVERGKLALDVPLSGADYTLQHLLQHTSGLEDYAGRDDYVEAVMGREDPWTDEELLKRIKSFSSPGRQWYYSNAGYLLVRRLIEEKTGSKIDKALKHYVFDPLEIKGARIAHTREDIEGCLWGNAHGYHPGWVYHGLLISTPAEAVMIMRGLMTGKLLSDKYQGKMLETREANGPWFGRPWNRIGYGLGVMADSSAALGVCFGHSGSNPLKAASSAAVYHFPQHKPPLTVAAFANVPAQSVVEEAVLRTAAWVLSHKDGFDP